MRYLRPVPSALCFTMLLLGVYAAPSTVYASTSLSAESVEPNAAGKGACCLKAKCLSGLTVSGDCTEQGGTWVPGGSCSDNICDLGTCCRVSTTNEAKYCGGPSPGQGCFRTQCPEHSYSNTSKAFVFLKGVDSPTACQRLKGACCIQQSSGRRVCKRLGFEECQAQDGFMRFNFNKSCAEAKCSSRKYGACCFTPPEDPSQPQLEPDECLSGFEQEGCTNGMNLDFAPAQACGKRTLTENGFTGTGTTCDDLSGACCFVNDAGTSKCDDKLTAKKCMALPGFVGFAYSKKCSESACAKFGACCNMDPLANKKPPTCIGGRTADNCDRQPGSANVFIPAAPCSACQKPLVGACCVGSPKGQTTCMSNMEYKNCTSQTGYLRFTFGKDCEKDKVACGKYGACCVPSFTQSKPYVCVGSKSRPHLTEADCTAEAAKYAVVYGRDYPDPKPQAVWKSGVSCPILAADVCPAAYP